MNKNKQLIFWEWLGTWFKSGYLKPAPGTWGTLAGLLCIAPIGYFLDPAAILILAFPLYFLGAKAADICSDILQKHDAKEIVIDEVVGIMIPLGLFPITLFNCILAFVFFRIFDIFKPWPVGYFDREIHSGHGIMLDDVVAGFYAALCMALVHFFF